MHKTSIAACLVATAFAAAPARAQTPAPPDASATINSTVSAAEFVDKAANSDMFEIQSSQLALNKTQHNRIRAFAEHMVQDHTAASDKLKAAAQGQPVPASPDQEHTQMLQQLQQASGNDFNRSYVQMQFDGHQKAVALFEGYARNGDNPQLKQFAQQTVPTLREHLQQITQIRTEISNALQVGQNQPGSAGQPFMTQERPGHWRASGLEGLNVYNNNDEKIGDISELIVDNSGKIQAVVIGVGGFLGMGQRDVAVPFDQIKFVNEPRTNAAGTNTGTIGTAPNAGASVVSAPSNPTATPTNPTAPAAPAGRSVGRATPDHAMLNMNKDQLKAAPEFKYTR